MAPAKRTWFSHFAKRTAKVSGKPATFLVAASIVVLWGLTGPIFDFSDTWQLVINTSTTIVTFLMVFLIQNTQNRDSEAMQVKLDEVIRVISKARNELLDLEDLEESEIDEIRQRYEELAQRARKGIKEDGRSEQ